MVSGDDRCGQRHRNRIIDWTGRANLRVIVKRILHRYGYQPVKLEKATQTVLEQSALLFAAWVAA